MAPKSRDPDYRAMNRAKERYHFHQDGRWYKRSQVRAARGRWSTEQSLNANCGFASLEEAVAHEMALTAKRRSTWARPSLEVTPEKVPKAHFLGRPQKEKAKKEVGDPNKDLLTTIRIHFHQHPGCWPFSGEATEQVDLEAALAAFLIEQDAVESPEFLTTTVDIPEVELYIAEKFGVPKDSLKPHRDEIQNLIHKVFGQLDQLDSADLEEVNASKTTRAFGKPS